MCPCGGPLLARYDLETARRSWSRDWIKHGPATMWRYAPVLPVRKPGSIVSLGEGMTPLVRAARLGERLGARNLWIKDEGLNPTGSFKARGLSCAVSMAVELGLRKVAIPSAGNAAGALAAYAAAAGIEAHVFLPHNAPQANYIECKAFGAQVTLDAGANRGQARISRRFRNFVPVPDLPPGNSSASETEGWFELGALKEPYRIEGKKTLGYEVAEQSNWDLPDVILCPAGDGLGLIGMCKAFGEMEALGWIGGKRPKMIAVQAEGCAPVVRAFERGAERCDFFENAATLAAGLRVPKPLGDFLILNALRASGGAAVAASDAELLDAGVELAACEGIFAAPEGAACAAALRKLLGSGFLKPEERIVICNTGSGLKYLEAYSTRFPRQHLSEQDKLGGLITPR